MFDIGGGELLLILIFVLVAFGPKKIPELSRSLGRGLREFRRAQREFTDQINTAFVEEEHRSQRIPRPANTIGRRTTTHAADATLGDGAGRSDEFPQPTASAAGPERVESAPHPAEPVQGTIARGSSSAAGITPPPADPPGRDEPNPTNDRPTG